MNENIEREPLRTARFKNVTARLVDHIIPGQIREIPERKPKDDADLTPSEQLIINAAKLDGAPTGMLTGERLRKSVSVKAGWLVEITDGGDGPPMPPPKAVDLANIPLDKAIKLISVEKDVAILMQWEDDPRPEIRSAIEARAAEL